MCSNLSSTWRHNYRLLKWFLLLLCQICDRVEGIPWPKTGANRYHAQLGHPDKNRTIKELVV